MEMASTGLRVGRLLLELYDKVQLCMGDVRIRGIIAKLGLVSIFMLWVIVMGIMWVK